MVAYDYSQMADLYDLFCVFDGDVDFFRRRVKEHPGPILELMAGTGRISVPLLADGADLVCLDLSPAMLRLLRAKKGPDDRCPTAVTGDVCEQPFSELFDLVILPFQGLSELADERDHDRLLTEVARVLRPGGLFICTTHNPALRQQTIDGEWHELGTFPTPDGGRLALALRTERVGESLVRGRQQVRRIDPEGRVQETREVELEFSLPQPEDLLSKAATAGLEVVEMLGDYDEGLWDKATSPCFIVTFQKP